MRLRLAAIALSLLVTSVGARDQGQWAGPEDIKKWYSELMQPDVNQSCCGEADAWWADGFEVDGDRYVAIITDDRDDGSLGRRHIPNGTRVVVPNNKLKFDRGNPTGHGVIFIAGDSRVLCYVTPGGI